MKKSESNNGESASHGNASASGATASGSVGTASDSIAAASGTTAPASGSTGTASNGTGVSLGAHIRERKPKSGKLFLDTEPLDEKDIMNAEHVAGMKNDFADLLNVKTDCNFFQFKSEKDWNEEAANTTFSCHKFFNLNLELLSQGLECLPFYDKITIEKDKFSESQIEACDTQAGKGLEKYKDMRENYEKELKEDEKFSKSFEDLTGIKWELRKPREVKPEGYTDPMEEEMDPEAPHRGRFWTSHRTELKEKGDDSFLAPSSSDESLEIWLDTYLDD